MNFEIINQSTNGKFLGTHAVSILYITFNHSFFIEKSLNYILGQQFDQKIQLIIYDDASTDDSVSKILKIISKERDKYDIVTIFNRSNCYDKKSPIFEALKYATGEFIAICEGDDFWIDNRKIDKQYQSLRNSNFFANFHTCNYFLDSNKIILDDEKSIKEKITRKNFIRGTNHAHFSTLFFRNCLKIPETRIRGKHDDKIINYLIGKKGEICFCDGIEANIHNIHAKGIVGSGNSKLVLRNQIMTRMLLFEISFKNSDFLDSFYFTKLIIYYSLRYIKYALFSFKNLVAYKFFNRKI